MKKAALVNYHNDLDMLEMQYRTGQFDFYDKVYIFDGPYRYVSDSPLHAGSDTEFIKTDFGQQIINNDKFVYSYKVYEDEYEKRVSAYKIIDEELVFIHDTDEFYEYDQNAIAEFIASEKGVGYFRCQNLCADGVTFSSNNVKGSNDLPLKAFAFKKQIISEIEHINYLWLVGVLQGTQNNNLKYSPELAFGYHFTEMRTPKGQGSKYLFYGLLRNETHPSDDFAQFVQKLEGFVRDGSLNIAEARDIYMLGMPTFFLVPNLFVSQNIFLQERIRYSENLERICKLVASKRNIFRPGTYNFVEGKSLFFYIHRYISEVEIRIPLQQDFDLKLHCYPLDELTKENIFHERISGSRKINLGELSEDNTHGFLMQLTYWGGTNSLIKGVEILI